MDTEQIIFEFTTQYGTFRDALYLPSDHGLSEDQLNAMKQERLDIWIAAITALPTELLNENG